MIVTVSDIYKVIANILKIVIKKPKTTCLMVYVTSFKCTRLLMKKGWFSEVESQLGKSFKVSG